MNTSLAPAVIIHLAAVVPALLLGPVALTARKGSRLHRGAGYAWATLMLAGAASSLFIRDFSLPNLSGYTPIHLLTVLTFVGIGGGIWHIAHHRVRAHRMAMWATYLGGCVAAGLFALLPSRYLGGLLWQALT